MSEITLKYCPICGRPGRAETRPFCSVRCADVDLGRWLTDSYAIPVAADESDPEENEAEPGFDPAGQRRPS